MNEESKFIFVPRVPIPGILTTFMPIPQMQKMAEIETAKKFQNYIIRALVSESVSLSFLPEEFVRRKSKSLLLINGNPLTIYLHHGGLNAIFYDLVPREDKELSHIDVEVSSDHPLGAVAPARTAINQLLDTLMREMWLPLTIIRLDVYVKGEDSPLLHQFIFPYTRQMAFGPMGGYDSVRIFANYESLVREAINTTSPYYRLLCVFRLYEGYLYLRREIRHLCKKFNITEPIPRPPKIDAEILRELHFGSDILDNVRTLADLIQKFKVLRHSVAHFILTDKYGGSSLHISQGESYQIYSNASAILLHYAYQGFKELFIFFGSTLNGRFMGGSILPEIERRGNFVIKTQSYYSNNVKEQRPNKEQKETQQATMLKFHNTLSGQLEEFTPLNGNDVRMYICGPTVWNFAHIGNFRSFTFGDILRRYLRYKGYKVTHVMNLTDVDDRIINESNTAGKTIDEFVQPYIDAFWEDMDALGIERPEIAPRATRHIAEMIDIIGKLIDKGLAYESAGSIYYRIAGFPEYGKLSKINFAGNITGASGRVDTDKYDKENAQDFALWKLVPADEPKGWDAPFGRGRPGWHIECSAMSMKYLGETFDIHGGGIDLKFPHHENEIAQSEGATGKLFAKYWLHGEFLKIESEKMSKSLGNDYTFRDLRDRGFNPTAMRYLFFSVPYDKQLNFTFDNLKGAESTIERLRDFRARLLEANLDEGSNDEVTAQAKVALKKFETAMDDNLNTSAALAALHDLVREINTALAGGALKADDRERVLDTISKIDSVFNIFGEMKEELLDADIEALIEKRQQARRDKNFARSDEIRDELAAKGIILEDTKEGVRWKRR